MFSGSLTAFLDRDAPAPPAATGASTDDPSRQEDADDGKTLPDDAAPAGTPAWLAMAMLPPAPPLPIDPAAPVAAAPATAVDANAALPGGAVHSGLAAAAIDAAQAPAPTAPLATAPASATDPANQVQSTVMNTEAMAQTGSGASSIASSDLAAQKKPVAPPGEARASVPSLAPAPVPSPAAGTIAPALEVFRAAIHAAHRQDERRGSAIGDDAADDTPVIGTPPPAAAAPMIAATGDAAQSALDMRQDRWPQAMIDRIDALRDNADATDTRIRLVPDALGTIDVAMKKDGDTVSVQFSADQAATRTLLADAQPRLAELAEARGLKIAQSSVDDGSGGRQRQPAPQPFVPTPVPAPRRAAAGIDSIDIRIA